MENVYEALAMISTWANIWAILGGVLFGTVMGAIPGLTGTMAVALALPFTFTLEPITAILLLVGIYKGSIYGGSISAILLKTPGTPSSSCTVIDGYPLMQQGKGKKALYMALYASCIADFISCLALIFFTGSIAGIALRFGPPEFFTLICFSLTIIAGVSGDSLLKGLIAASLGLLLATVGMDLIYGTNRFVFDKVELMGGLNFIPVLIGIFALPDMIYAVTRHEMGVMVQKKVGEGLRFTEVKQNLGVIFRGSCIGVILGAMPGIGAAPAAFLSYSTAKVRSKQPELYGKGSLEGLAAAESGNNGVCAAAMIPLLSLGVPGDVITGIILGAFMMHGLTPGPTLFAENLPFVHAIYAGFLVSSLGLLVVGDMVIRMFYVITKLSHKIIYPAVLVICFYGVYAINNQTFDIMVMIASGFLGYAMMRFDFPAPPFLIAFILGPLCEDNLRRSLVLSGGSTEIFFRSPICLIFVGLTVISVGLIAAREWKKKQAGRNLPG